jgi:hypothetical protein
MLIMIKTMELENYKVKVQRTIPRINRKETKPRLLERMPNRALKLLIHLRKNTYMLGLDGAKQQTVIALQRG